MPESGAPGQESSPSITIASDGMVAYLTLPTTEAGFSEADIKAALAKAGVTHGVDWTQVSILLASGGPASAVPIAQGTAPEAGIDSRIEFLFDTNSSELQEKAGRVDWHELNLVHSVEEGTPVARKHPAQAGKPGTNVRGQAIPPKPPKDIRLMVGQGAALAADDPNVVVASSSGAIRVDSSGRITVDSTYVVKGDVDLSSGNVDFVGSVVIERDVKKGFAVKATGDVEVKGVVEEASITAAGSIIVQGGVLGGSSATPIQAGKDIMAKFANNAVLRAGHDVVLGQEAINCDIEAEGRVIVGGNPPTRGAVMGGSIRATQEIVVFNVGASGGQKTRLQTGFDWLLRRKLSLVDNDIESRKAQLEKVQKDINLLEGRGDLTSDQRLALEKLKLAKGSDQMSLHALENRRASLLKLASASSSISAYGVTRAGTTLVVDGKLRALSDDRQKERFVTEGDIVIGVPVEK